MLFVGNGRRVALNRETTHPKGSRKAELCRGICKLRAVDFQGLALVRIALGC